MKGNTNAVEIVPMAEYRVSLTPRFNEQKRNRLTGYVWETIYFYLLKKEKLWDVSIS